MPVYSVVFLLLAGVLLAACAPAPGPALEPPTPPAHPHHDAEALEAAADPHSALVDVDPIRREVVVTMGPFHVPAHHGSHTEADRTPVLAFEWPVEGWLRGFQITTFDEDGRLLPRDIMHHMITYNFERRQLIHPGVERLFGIGRETRDVVLPARIGVPLARGTRLGAAIMWHNETGRDLEAVYVRMVLPYTPDRPGGIAHEAYPFHVDVNYSITGSNEFDIPPGRTTRSVEFVLPIDGGLLGASGHLHDYGVALRLEDVETGRTLFTLRTGKDRAGELTIETKVFRKLLGLRSAPLRLEAGRRYRLVSVYENPTEQTIVLGAMAHIAGLFKPDDPAAWPALDQEDPEIRLDLAVLSGEAPRDAPAGHHHHHHH